MTRSLRLIALACVLVLLWLDRASSAPAPALLTVQPMASIDATVSAGEPAKAFTYRIASTRGNINWSYTGPSWLRASAVNGKTPATVTITTVTGLPVGTYTGIILFQGSANGVVLSARLVVVATVAPPSAGCPGYLLGNVGAGYLTTNSGDRLAC